VGIGAYVRVSSRSQSIDTQKDAIKRAARARGDTVDVWFAETASGRTSDRPVLSRVRAAARLGELSVLYVYRLDRLTRAGIRDTLALLSELAGHGVKVVSISDGIDPSGPMGEILIAVLAWAAQVERLVLGERISAARERMRGEGRPWGRPRRVTSEVTIRIASLLADGKSIRVIAQHVGVPRSTVSRLKRELSQKPPSEPPPSDAGKRPKYLPRRKGRGAVP
jgi:DNA invertase Pin-like site-specific DNA recombinase